MPILKGQLKMCFLPRSISSAHIGFVAVVDGALRSTSAAMVALSWLRRTDRKNVAFGLAILNVSLPGKFVSPFGIKQIALI